MFGFLGSVEEDSFKDIVDNREGFSPSDFSIMMLKMTKLYGEDIEL